LYEIRDNMDRTAQRSLTNTSAREGQWPTLGV